MAWEALDTTWQDITAGRLCSLCEAALPAPPRPAMRYCRSCVPTPADTQHLVHVGIDHHVEGWSVQFSSKGPPPLLYWMVRLTDDQLARIVERSRMAPHDRAMHPRAMHAWGRNTFYAHMTEAQYRNLRRAWQHDPRNGYEKTNGLPLGATRRMRV